MNNIMQMVAQMRQNPQQYFGQLQGVNMSNPNEIIDYMVRNGKVTQQQINQAMNFAKQMGFKK